MYRLIDVAQFALSEFDRGLSGLTDGEARVRVTKADGSEMNAISWTACHIGGHWLWRPERWARFADGSDDPTPPPLEEALALLREARAFIDGWMPGLDDERLASKGFLGESIGTAIMRATLHTWFHAGEINAVRQMLGHAEISFVGTMIGQLEWQAGE